MSFMRDTAPIHKAKKILDWLGLHGVETTEWPLFSPDPALAVSSSTSSDDVILILIRILSDLLLHLIASHPATR
jgi:hypothetical protein